MNVDNEIDHISNKNNLRRKILELESVSSPKIVIRFQTTISRKLKIRKLISR